jgi:hypothetical protein
MHSLCHKSGRNELGEMVGNEKLEIGPKLDYLFRKTSRAQPVF